MEVFTWTDSSAHDLPMQNMLRSTSAEKSVAVESARVNRALALFAPFPMGFLQNYSITLSAPALFSAKCKSFFFRKFIASFIFMVERYIKRPFFFF